VHVVGDALYRGPAWRGLPARVTFTTRLAANAVLYGPEPLRTGRRGHPAWKGGRLGTATEMAATGEQIVARYASRWSIEQSIKDSKNLLGAGDAHNRLPAAVERTTPLGLANLTILILWYERAGQPDADLNSRRQAAPCYRRKHHVCVEDMIVAFRRAPDNRHHRSPGHPTYSTRLPRPATLPPRKGETSDQPR
jgi:hypothetical protein